MESTQPPPESTEPPPTAAEPPPTPPDPSPSTLPSTEPPPAAASQPPQPLSQPPPPPPSSVPSTPPPSTSSPSPSHNPLQSQPQSQPPQPPQPTFLPTHQQQRPPLPRNRPQSQPQPSYPSSSSIQRSGIAIGVPAIPPHHPRPPQPLPFSSYRPSPPFSQPFPTSNAPSPSFSQPFAGLPRSSTGMSDPSPTSNTQVRLPGSAVHTIGMIGSLSSAANASQMRPSGVTGLHQQRLGQPSMRSASPPTSQNLSSQKLQSHGVLRAPSMGSLNSPSSAPQGSQSLQQQWMSVQGKPTHASSLTSTSYRPQIKQHVMQQRPQPPQQPQHQVPMTSNQQQQQKQHQLQLQQLPPQQHQQISVPQSQEFLQTPRNQQSLIQQQQAARAHGSATLKSNVPASVQPAAVHSGAVTTLVTTDAAECCHEIISKRSIHELVTQIDPSEKFDPDVEDVLVEIANDFIESITTAACSLAKHRKSSTLEAKDILLHVERNWNMTLPGFSGDEIKVYKKPSTNDIHKERLAMIKKSMAGANDSGSTKNPSTVAGQAAANSKAHAAKTPAAGVAGTMASPNEREQP